MTPQRRHIALGEPDAASRRRNVGPAVYLPTMPPRRRRPIDVKATRPAKPYLPDGTLDPREWEIACSSAGALALVVLAREPWFVSARPVEVYGQGVALEVEVRWLSLGGPEGSAPER